MGSLPTDFRVQVASTLVLFHSAYEVLELSQVSKEFRNAAVAVASSCSGVPMQQSMGVVGGSPSSARTIAFHDVLAAIRADYGTHYSPEDIGALFEKDICEIREELGGSILELCEISIPPVDDNEVSSFSFSAEEPHATESLLASLVSPARVLGPSTVHHGSSCSPAHGTMISGRLQMHEIVSGGKPTTYGERQRQKEDPRKWIGAIIAPLLPQSLCCPHPPGTVVAEGEGSLPIDSTPPRKFHSGAPRLLRRGSQSRTVSTSEARKLLRDLYCSSTQWVAGECIEIAGTFLRRVAPAAQVFWVMAVACEPMGCAAVYRYMVKRIPHLTKAVYGVFNTLKVTQEMFCEEASKALEDGVSLSSLVPPFGVPPALPPFGEGAFSLLRERAPKPQLLPPSALAAISRERGRTVPISGEVVRMTSVVAGGEMDFSLVLGGRAVQKVGVDDGRTTDFSLVGSPSPSAGRACHSLQNPHLGLVIPAVVVVDWWRGHVARVPLPKLLLNSPSFRDLECLRLNLSSHIPPPAASLGVRYLECKWTNELPSQGELEWLCDPAHRFQCLRLEVQNPSAALAERAWSLVREHRVLTAIEVDLPAQEGEDGPRPILMDWSDAEPIPIVDFSSASSSLKVVSLALGVSFRGGFAAPLSATEINLESTSFRSISVPCGLTSLCIRKARKPTAGASTPPSSRVPSTRITVDHPTRDSAGLLRTCGCGESPRESHSLPCLVSLCLCESPQTHVESPPLRDPGAPPGHLDPPSVRLRRLENRELPFCPLIEELDVCTFLGSPVLRMISDEMQASGLTNLHFISLKINRAEECGCNHSEALGVAGTPPLPRRAQQPQQPLQGPGSLYSSRYLEQKRGEIEYSAAEVDSVSSVRSLLSLPSLRGVRVRDWEGLIRKVGSSSHFDFRDSSHLTSISVSSLVATGITTGASVQAVEVSYKSLDSLEAVEFDLRGASGLTHLRVGNCGSSNPKDSQWKKVTSHFSEWALPPSERAASGTPLLQYSSRSPAPAKSPTRSANFEGIEGSRVTVRLPVDKRRMAMCDLGVECDIVLPTSISPLSPVAMNSTRNLFPSHSEPHLPAEEPGSPMYRSSSVLPRAATPLGQTWGAAQSGVSGASGIISNSNRSLGNYPVFLPANSPVMDTSLLSRGADLHLRDETLIVVSESGREQEEEECGALVVSSSTDTLSTSSSFSVFSSPTFGGTRPSGGISQSPSLLGGAAAGVHHRRGLSHGSIRSSSLNPGSARPHHHSHQYQHPRLSYSFSPPGVGARTPRRSPQVLSSRYPSYLGSLPPAQLGGAAASFCIPASPRLSPAQSPVSHTPPYGAHDRAQIPCRGQPGGDSGVVGVSALRTRLPGISSPLFSSSSPNVTSTTSTASHHRRIIHQ